MITIPAKDGYQLMGQLYIPSSKVTNNKVLIINSATAVSRKLYHHYATFMAEHGYHVITYDYRGIAASRPKKLRGFKATFLDWGDKDFAGVINYVKKEFPNQKILTLGHSIGGTIIGMTEKNTEISGVITVGAQTAYYKDWPKKQRAKIYFLWHIILPWITNVVGYFPGKKLGMLEDVPKGVIHQWHNRRKHTDIKKQLENNGVKLFYNTYQSKLLTLGIEDDPIGTEQAIKRIHNLFKSNQKEIEIIRLEEILTDKIGHFGFFRRKFKETLWVKTVKWFDNL
ncbi:alpha/beta fold hydrolase [Aquimarina algiphila]|uniref:alpha/beta hydrolase family protein n=1 Tax=Aquimarina algiphila TaxID=2047982 RepID=UPI00232A9461|nr:alpha/beta fold hydrolase [Aquimarina algiphila]